MKALIPVIILLMLAASCKKRAEAPPNHWKVGSRTYQTRRISTTYLSPRQSLLIAQDRLDSNISTINFYFETLPTVSGSYKVIRNPEPLGNQLYLLVNAYSGNKTYSRYTPADSQHVMAKVSVTEGRISIDLPDLWARNVTNGDSVKVSAQVSQ